MNDAIQLRSSRPMLPMGFVKLLLDCTEDKVLAMVECGELAWAWDIRHPKANRREVRVWYLSVICRSEGIAQPSATEDEVVFSLFPHDERELRAPEVQRMFCASQCHVQHLIDSGALRGTKGKPGCAGAALVNRGSVLDFLKKRQII